MKLKIKVKVCEGSTLPTITGKGDWVDLRSRVNMELNKGSLVLIPLGIMMKLPAGFEAHLLPRSSTPKSYGMLMANSQGVIDSSYCGDDDEWKFSALGLKHTKVHIGERICQFRIQLSQKATVWQKLKWLFSNGIEFEEVESLDEESRGGFGSTGRS